MIWLKMVNALLVAILVLLVRKLIWCLRWLWCYYHDREVPKEISFLPRRTDNVFEDHLLQQEKEE